MGFIRGVITGVAVAGAAAAWYLSKAGATFRNQYRVDRKLGALGDEIEERTRDVRSRANAQVAEMRLRDDGEPAAMTVADKLDEAQASAAEAAAKIAADVEARSAKVKKQARDSASR